MQVFRYLDYIFLRVMFPLAYNVHTSGLKSQNIRFPRYCNVTEEKSLTHSWLTTVQTVTTSVFFTAQRSYGSAVLGVVLLSVRPSVCLSHVCFVTKPNNALRIFWYHTKGCHFSFLTPIVVGGRRSFCLKFALKASILLRKTRQISAYNVSTVHALHGLSAIAELLVIILDDYGVFAANLGNLHDTSARYSGMWICWWTVPSGNTG